VFAADVADVAECGECGVVSAGEGVEVLLGGGDAAVAEAFFDGFAGGAASEHPGGVGVAEVVGADGGVECGGGDGWLPDVAAEPVARQVASGVGGVPRGTRGVFAGGAARGAVDGVGVAAAGAAAGGHVVGGDGAVPIAASGAVRLRHTEVDRTAVVDRAGLLVRISAYAVLKCKPPISGASAGTRLRNRCSHARAAARTTARPRRPTPG
jgi:hypothetical protein